MAENSDKSKGGKPAQTRQDRLKKALKANLQRRKAQARARDGAEGGTEPTKEK